MVVNALLVYPRFPDTFWGFRHSLRFIGKKASYPPLGLLTVASMMPPEFKLRLVDMNVRPLLDSDVEWADAVFISAMLLQKNSLEKVIRRCAAMGKRTVLGGPYASSAVEGVPGVDHLVRGEAEKVFARFLEDLKRGKAAPLYESEEKPDLALAPLPRFDLIDMEDYASMALQFSRGCPFNCEFCDIIELFGRLPRTKAPERMLAELDCLYRAGHRGSVFFVDDNFIGNAPRVKEFLWRLQAWQKKRGMPFQFFTESSVNLAQDSELLGLMVDSGFTMAFLGIETPVEESLLSANKPQNLHADLLGSVEKIQRAGIEVTAGFIVGFDSDPEDIAERQIDFIAAAAIPTAMVGLLTALPGTRLARRLEAEGRLLYRSSGNNTFEEGFNFKPAMPAASLIRAYEEVVAQLYEPAAYFKRCAALLARLPAKRAVRRDIPGRGAALSYLAAFARSLAIQGLSPYVLSYFRFLLGTLVAHPRQFAYAVKLAIFGHHFFRMRESKVLERRRLAAVAKNALAGLCSLIVRTEKRLRGLSAGNATKATQLLYRKVVKRISSASAAVDRGIIGPAEEAMLELARKASRCFESIKATLTEKAGRIGGYASLRALKRLLAARRELPACLEALAQSSSGDHSAGWKNLIRAMDDSLSEPIRILSRMRRASDLPY